MDNSEVIREYISNNPGTTEHKVAEYMRLNHYCARDTAHYIIYGNLIPNGKVIDKKIANSRHKLYINDDDEFNKISQLLSEIEIFVQIMEGPSRKFIQIATAQHPEGFFHFIMFAYQGQIKQILRILLVRTSELVLPEKDSQMLYTRLAKLEIKIDLQGWAPEERGLTQMFKAFDSEEVKFIKSTPGLKKIGVDDKLIDNLVTIVESFKKWFATSNLT